MGCVDSGVEVCVWGVGGLRTRRVTAKPSPSLRHPGGNGRSPLAAPGRGGPHSCSHKDPCVRSTRVLTDHKDPWSKAFDQGSLCEGRAAQVFAQGPLHIHSLSGHSFPAQLLGKYIHARKPWMSEGFEPSHEHRSETEGGGAPGNTEAPVRGVWRGVVGARRRVRTRAVYHPRCCRPQCRREGAGRRAGGGEPGGTWARWAMAKARVSREMRSKVRESCRPPPAIEWGQRVEVVKSQG